MGTEFRQVDARSARDQGERPGDAGEPGVLVTRVDRLGLPVQEKTFGVRCGEGPMRCCPSTRQVGPAWLT